MSAGQQQAYSFPLLKAEEIFHCVREMHIPVAEEEIRQASASATKKVFEVFLETILKVTKEEISQPAFSGLSALSHPELHEEAIAELSFFRASEKMMNACGVYDFCLNDLINPTPKRLRRHLSAMINFAKFREERTAAFNDLTCQTDQLLELKRQEEEENEQLTRQLQELQSQQSAEEPAIKQLENECRDLENSINEYNNQQALLRHENSEFKKRSNQLRDDLSSQQYTNLDLEKKIEDLKSKVVNSPARFKKEITDIAVTHDNYKKDVVNSERKERELLAYLDTITRAEKDVKKTINLLNEIEKDMEKCKLGKQDVKDNRAKIQQFKVKDHDNAAVKQRLQRLIDIRSSNIDELRSQATLKLQAMDHALSSARDELSKIKKEDEQMKSQIQQNSELLSQLEIKKKKHDEDAESQIAEMTQIYEDLENAVKAYNSSITAALPA